MRGKSLALLAVAVLSTPAICFASELVYRPINPSFGGNPLYANHLLGIANAINDYEDPDRRTSAMTTEEMFTRQLQSRLLSGLSASVVEAIFGENAQEQGRFAFGNQEISFFRTLESVTVSITNTDTGDVTEIVLPNAPG